MQRQEVVEILEEIATLLELKGENPFKARAYSNAARVLASISDDLDELVEQGKLDTLEGIGESLRDKITELVRTGRLPYYEELKASTPASLGPLLRIPGLGPKRVKILFEKLKIADLETLEKACHDGSVAELDGFGQKTVRHILEGIEQVRSYQALHRYADVIGVAEELLGALRWHPDVIRVSLAGGLRRCKEIVKDVDLLVSSRHWRKVSDFFCCLPQVMRIVSHGETKASVVLQGGLPCDLRIVQDVQFPYALHHFTGSKEHNVALRQRAIEGGMKMSEWGLFHRAKDPKSEDDPSQLIPCKDEEELFQKLGLQYIPPELRENLGEFEAAQAKQIPRLVEWTDLRGCFHNHTTASDGCDSLENMVEAAEDLGLEYLGIADHSKSSTQANGLSEERLLRQVEKIRAYSQKKSDCYLFAGVECDILKSGQLDFEDSILAQLDYVVASVHSHFNLSEEEMTRRIIRAIENPYVTMLGHVTGRLLLKREPYAVDLAQIIDAAAATGTWIELNANPWRLDMDWRWWKRARDRGVKCVINPDAHAGDQLQFLRLGINMARKGWLRKEDVINTQKLSEVKKSLLLKRERFSLC